MPDEIAQQARATCARLRWQVEQAVEPFGDAGAGWLTGFLNGMNGADAGPE